MKFQPQLKSSICLLAFILSYAHAAMEVLTLHQVLNSVSATGYVAIDDTGNTAATATLSGTGNVTVYGRNGGTAFTEIEQLPFPGTLNTLDLSGDGELIACFIANNTFDHKIFGYMNSSVNY